MFEALGQNPKSKGLHLGDGFGLVGPVAHHASEVRDLGEPAAVLLLLDFDLEGHGRNVAPAPEGDKAPTNNQLFAAFAQLSFSVTARLKTGVALESLSTAKYPRRSN